MSGPPTTWAVRGRSPPPRDARRGVGNLPNSSGASGAESRRDSLLPGAPVGFRSTFWRCPDLHALLWRAPRAQGPSPSSGWAGARASPPAFRLRWRDLLVAFRREHWLRDRRRRPGVRRAACPADRYAVVSRRLRGARRLRHRGVCRPPRETAPRHAPRGPSPSPGVRVLLRIAAGCALARTPRGRRGGRAEWTSVLGPGEDL